MNKCKTLAALALLINLGVAVASEHHSGHAGMSGGGGGEWACLKPRFAKMLPANLATVAPGSDFSFQAFNVNKPESISAQVKGTPVKLVTEFKEPYYIVKGKLPASLKDVTARIAIKVTGKTQHCEAETGWLVKITAE